MKLNVKQLGTGEWAEFRGRRYYAATVRATEPEARIAALRRRGREAYNDLEEIKEELLKAGALDERDPLGFCV